MNSISIDSDQTLREATPGPGLHWSPGKLQISYYIRQKNGPTTGRPSLSRCQTFWIQISPMSLGCDLGQNRLCQVPTSINHSESCSRYHIVLNVVQNSGNSPVVMLSFYDNELSDPCCHWANTVHVLLYCPKPEETAICVFSRNKLFDMINNIRSPTKSQHATDKLKLNWSIKGSLTLAMGKCLWFSVKIKVCQLSLSSP